MSNLVHQIRWFVITVEHATMKEILTEFDHPERTVKRKVSELVESGELQHKKIHGTGTKRKLYNVNEEKTKNDMTMMAFNEKDMSKLKMIKDVDKLLSYQTISKITQRNLSNMITQERRFYRKELREFNKEYLLHHPRPVLMKDFLNNDLIREFSQKETRTILKLSW